MVVLYWDQQFLVVLVGIFRVLLGSTVSGCVGWDFSCSIGKKTDFGWFSRPFPAICEPAFLAPNHLVGGG